MVKGRIARRSRHVAKPMLGHASKLLWREALDRPSTIELLEDHTLDVNQDRDVTLPVLDPVSGVRPKAFDRNHYSFDPEYVWRITTGGTVRSIRITPSGTVLLNNKQLLDVDFGSWPGLLDLHGRRRMDDVSVAIAPWSHPWAAYYDFLMFVVGKLCRIKDVLAQESWADPTICYPWRGRSFEREFLEMLDLDPEAVVDTGASVGLRADEVIVSNTQPRWVPSPSAIAALRRHLLGPPPRSSGKRRIYLPRAKTRRVKNEGEVLRLLAAHGFETIDDRPRSVQEQIDLFRGASMIVAPHGSSLANLVWCDPGSQMVELFSASFTWSYYYYLCHQIGIGYHYLVDDSRKMAHWSNTQEDMHVDVRALEAVIERIAQQDRMDGEPREDLGPSPGA